eukprot:TRINITY_DN62981_c0_g1_i1.p1 TRINITY_DN62981_c0_g1~~TRINITY_DN62981_c0_g1_i1.p1  ORF type:complete len:393 (+),score=49.86 TRINITY_DN62981_c0_g1_i1:97-1275(+)
MVKDVKTASEKLLEDGRRGVQSYDPSVKITQTMLELESTWSDYGIRFSQKKAAALLLIASVFSSLGALLSVVLAFIHWRSGSDKNYLGEEFPSGNSYQPSTLSEMAHDLASQEGRAFYAFQVIAAICLLISFYPFFLRNVFVGDASVLRWIPQDPKKRNMRLLWIPSWATLRHYLPPIGMLMVAFMPTVPPVNRSIGDTILIGIHVSGAVLMIGGYCLAEVHCLWLAKRRSDAPLVFRGWEWNLRAFLIGCCICSATLFQVAGVIDKRWVYATCADVWRVPSKEEFEKVQGNVFLMDLAHTLAKKMRNQEKLLYDTSFGICRTVKQLEFWGELLAGLFMAASLLCIWCHCPERDIALRSTPPLTTDGHDQLLPSQCVLDCSVGSTEEDSEST